MASPSSAQKVVVVSGALLGASVIAQAKQGAITVPGGAYKQIWAVGVLTLALAATADFTPQLVVPLAVAVVVGYAVVHRGTLLGALIPSSSPAQPKVAGGTKVTPSNGGHVTGPTGISAQVPPNRERLR